ncbi:restriction endonuclease [Pseudactinotalea sp. Z1732]|uniref:restriction endonuclease n=1 Tax=Micrococcales TaxID=85006 RepID=UPI003C7C16EF
MATMPTWDEFMAPVLRALIDGRTLRLRELREAVMAAEQIPEDQRAELLPSGQPKVENRIGWAASYLNRVGALERPARGQYLITDVGRKLLADYPEGISEAVLRSMAREGDEWWIPKAPSGRESKSVAEPTTESTLDPEEQVEEGIARIHATVAADLLSRLHAQAPSFFEDAVLDLLIAMGYGGAGGKATRTQLSGDGGIDGIIDQDALGLSRVYVQAKRYALDTPIGRPEIQGFVGALHGNQASQGVFITTARFSRGAREYAESVATRVVLVDGERLASLMIHYGVGVQAKRTVQIVEIDEDFFE